MVTLVILDGFGINEKEYGNAIKLQTTPNLDKLKKDYPTTTLLASGESVGLEEGQMGNSEVGHLNLGAGKIIYQDLSKINRDIKTGEFYNNEQINKTIEHCQKFYSTLHIMGLLSNGGVHSHINHLKAIIEMAYKKVSNICIHAILDGRDTKRDSGIDFVKELQEFIKDKPNVCIASIVGRVYAMDRENRWDRVEKAYDMLTLGQCDAYYDNAENAIKDSYANGIYDEFFEPTIIGKPKTINSDDGVIFYNFRTDRAREITQAIAEDNFDNFERKILHNLMYCCMTEYSSDFKNVVVAYPPEKIEDNLSAILSKFGKKQFHISETTKYAHVTFFFNGGIEQAYEGEDRKLIESENVQDYSVCPKMKAFEITEEVVNQIASGKYDFVLVNLSNADMLGHTGNLEAAKKAIEAVDKCAYAIALATRIAGGDCIITADHGNAEKMLNDDGSPCTTHTTNPVPFILVSEKYKNVKLKKGLLANVAPTIFKLLGMEIPKDMENPLF